MKDFLEPDLRIIIFKTEDILADVISNVDPTEDLDEGGLPID